MDKGGVSMIKRILIIDEDNEYIDYISSVLKENGYLVSKVNSVLDGIAMLFSQDFDLIITELHLKEINGLQMFFFIKKIGNSLPIVILTNSENYQDEIQSLEVNVEEYINKSVNIEVLLMRINKLVANNKVEVNRGNMPTRVVLSQSEKLEINPLSRNVIKNGEIVKVTRTEYALLMFFLKNKNIAYSRVEILRNLKVSTTNEKKVDIYVKILRQKLSLTSIVTLRGVGYMWNE
jgi:Response regulators consisting of a CheY-like receiver domain and a winged-helix DNA-binding domain